MNESFKAYDKLEKVLDTLPKTKDFADNEDYFYIFYGNFLCKYFFNINPDKFFETHQEKMQFLTSMLGFAKEYQSKIVS